MSNYLIQSGTLEAIANAIRTKKGTSNTMTPAQMPTEIAGISGVENVEWHQDVDAVRNYISNVNYTNVAYTESSITTYAPNPPVVSNTKPIGKTVGGKTYYNTIPNANTPFAGTGVAGTLNPLDQVRWINSKTSNMRDLGGWPCDGGTVKYGLLYRSGELNSQDEDLLINQLGINTECDLTADGVPAFPGKMRYIGHTSYAMYSLANTEAWRVNLRGIFEAVRYGDPVIFHCSMGADRTGTLACVLEGLLGVSRSNIDKDYELTSFYAIRARNGNYQGGTTDWAHLIAQIEALSGNTFRDKCVSFVVSLGFTAAEINAYRSAMINGTPEAVVAQTYSVTNNLTNCTTNNSATQIGINESYMATITANSGYTLDEATVSVKMAGTDITSMAYSNGVINIQTVTGVIVIQIAAAKEKTLKELFDPSAATINQRFNSSGAYSAQNGNFCTDFIPVSGLDTSDPWTIHIKDTTDATRFRTAATQESVAYFNASKTILSTNSGRLAIVTSTTNNTLHKQTDTNGGVVIDINHTGDGNQIPSTFFDLSQVAYIRVCMAYSSGTAIPDTATLANVSITADKILNDGGDEPTNLFDSNDADVTLRGRINSSGNAVAYADGQLVTGFIEASAGDVFRIETDKALDTNAYTGSMATYTTTKGFIWTSSHANQQAWTLEDGGLASTVTVLSVVNGHDQTGTAYVRFCVAYTDIGNIKIYKQ
jgi:protein-tyrosine phosphatase